jgi:hypothetical protein
MINTKNKKYPEQQSVKIPYRQDLPVNQIFNQKQTIMIKLILLTAVSTVVLIATIVLTF